MEALICNQPGEQLMWRAKFGDKTLDEFVDGKETNFLKEVQCKKELTNFGLVGQGIYLNFDLDKGIFNLDKDHLKFSLQDMGHECITPDGENKLIMFRTNQSGIAGGRLIDHVVGYSIGYRINNEYINARIFVSINMYQGLSINFDFTPKKDISGPLRLFNNERSIVKFEPTEDKKFLKDKRYNMPIKLSTK